VGGLDQTLLIVVTCARAHGFWCAWLTTIASPKAVQKEMPLETVSNTTANENRTLFNKTDNNAVVVTKAALHCT
jgi:hypothetical protein